MLRARRALSALQTSKNLQLVMDLGKDHRARVPGSAAISSFRALRFNRSTRAEALSHLVLLHMILHIVRALLYLSTLS